MSEASTASPAGPGGRGPAPPLPEKPPSIAERTRLLRSGFRKEEVVEKPRPPDNRAMGSSGVAGAPPPLAEKPSMGGSQGALNAVPERSPSPGLNSAGPLKSNGVAGNMSGGTNSTLPSTTTLSEKTVTYTQPATPGSQPQPQPQPQPPATAPAAAPGDQNGKTPINSAKRDAFFRAAGQTDSPQAPSGVKFDPSSRFASANSHDRERGGGSALKEKDSNTQAEMEKEKDLRSKYVGETRKELEGYVGFANLPNQVYRKSVKKGFEFTLMVVGESGLGKSTLINSLFLSDLYSAEYPGPSHRIKKTVSVDTNQTVLKENGVQLKLTVVDTPGFGDAVDNSNCWQPITDYIDCKYEEYLNAESRVNRSIMPDTRVHCCLYFIAPTGHGLKPLDVEFMKRLHDKVNIIPLIAKADTMTPDECREFKKTILNEIAQHKIKIYEFPDCDDEEEMKIQKKLRDRVPFAVVGSNRVIEMGGKRLRGRQYPWGLVEVENLEHNDFIGLRNMLIRTHMQDLKDVTNNVHYENFRYNKLAPSSADSKIKPGSLTKDPLTQMAEERQEHNLKMKKMEAEMEQVFEMKVKEKKQKLQDSEADLQKRSEQMKKSLEQQQSELDEKWKSFEKEKGTWEEQWGERRRSMENLKDTKKDKKRLF